MNRGVFAVVFLMGVSGCATVQPWQRERLAHRCMEMDGSPGNVSWEEHLRAVRIGDVHASAGGGGGCGCN